MSGHGGYRAGAGAPRGGISDTRRRLLAAIESGVEKAGRHVGLTGSREEVIEETGARMVCDLILSGQVRDVLAIWGQNATKDKEQNGDKNGKGSLVSALHQASNMLANGTKTVQTPHDQTRDPATTPHNADRTRDTESTAPLKSPDDGLTFIPQKSLPLVVPGTQEGGKGLGATPPGGTSRSDYRVESENFEKNSEIFSGDEND